MMLSQGSADVAAVNALIALITDPKASKERLKELVEAAERAEEAQRAHADVERVTAQKFADAESKLAMASKMKAEAEAWHDEHLKILAAREAKVEGHSAGLAKKQATFASEQAARNADAQTREDALNARALNLAGRELALDACEKANRRQFDELQERRKKLDADEKAFELVRENLNAWTRRE